MTAGVATVAVVMLVGSERTAGTPGVAMQHAAARPACVPADARLLAARGEAGVYRRSGRITACNAQRGGFVLDDPPTSRVFLPPVLKIRGNLIAYVEVTDDTDVEAVDLTLLDLADDAPARSVQAGGYVKIASLRLTAGGTVAWIACQTTFPPELRNGKGTNCYRTGRHAYVAKAVPTGDDLRFTELDRDRTITPSSLRLKGRTLSWTKAGRRHTARL